MRPVANVKLIARWRRSEISDFFLISCEVVWIFVDLLKFFALVPETILQETRRYRKLAYVCKRSKFKKILHDI
jgi:hypothetical protein